MDSAGILRRYFRTDSVLIPNFLRRSSSTVYIFPSGQSVNGRTYRIVTYLDGVYLYDERLDDGEGEKRAFQPFCAARLLCGLYCDRVRRTKEWGLWGPTPNLGPRTD